MDFATKEFVVAYGVCNCRVGLDVFGKALYYTVAYKFDLIGRFGIYTRDRSCAAKIRNGYIVFPCLLPFSAAWTVGFNLNVLPAPNIVYY